MASEWFYKVLGDEVGPVSAAELRNLAQHGTIDCNTLVKRSSDGEWVLAERLQGLFSVSDAPSSSKMVIQAAGLPSEPTPPKDPTVAHLAKEHATVAHLAKIEKLLERMVERSHRPKEYKVVVIENKLLTAPFDPAKIAALLNSHARDGWSVKGMAEFDPPGFTGSARAILVAMER